MQCMQGKARQCSEDTRDSTAATGCVILKKPGHECRKCRAALRRSSSIGVIMTSSTGDMIGEGVYTSCSSCASLDVPLAEASDASLLNEADRLRLPTPWLARRTLLSALCL